MSRLRVPRIQVALVVALILGLGIVPPSAAQTPRSQPPRRGSQPKKQGEKPQKSAKKESVEFDGEKLVIAFEDRNDVEILKEYIPAGEELDSWTKLASIRELLQQDDPEQFAKAHEAAMKEHNPLAQSQILSNAETGETMLDFITWPEDMAFVEFNIFKYSKRPGGGLVAQQYALRAYDDQEEFVKKLKDLRGRLILLMAEDGLKKSSTSKNKSGKRK